MGEPDDPLRADDALVGAEHEDVLLDAGAPDEREPAAGYDESGHDDVDEHPTSIAALDDRPTTELPRVVEPVPVPEPRGRLSGVVAPWVVFAVVAVVVVAATSTLAAWLQGPTAERQSFTGLIQPVPSATSSAPQPAEAAPSPPPSAEPEPRPEPKPERVARPTQRPRATRAPAPPLPPPPPAAAVNAPATTDGKKKDEGESAAKTPAPGPAAADAEAAGKAGDTESAKKTPEKSEDDSSEDD